MASIRQIQRWIIEEDGLRAGDCPVQNEEGKATRLQHEHMQNKKNDYSELYPNANWSETWIIHAANSYNAMSMADTGDILSKVYKLCEENYEVTNIVSHRSVIIFKTYEIIHYGRILPLYWLQFPINIMSCYLSDFETEQISTRN